MSNPLHHRKGFGLKAAVATELRSDYHSGLVERIRERGHHIQLDDLEIKLARDFGFCYGVERAVDMAYETREKFPGRRLLITNEIIHNPFVNKRLRDLGVEFLNEVEAGGLSIEDVGVEDVVIIPAFGVTVEEMQRLSERGAVLVDTTCGSVLNVWRRVERYASQGMTSVVHGKWSHEETQATCSRALSHPAGHYLVVHDLAETDLVCDYIENGGERADFEEQFPLGEKASPGFDPDRHLERIGVANQTTMLSGESLEISKRLEEAIRRRSGEAGVAEQFLSFDTICSATQDRQDAVLSLARGEKIDLFLVIGGFNSSNTTHLAEISGSFAPSFHIDGVRGLVSRDRIRFKRTSDAQMHEQEGWLPEGPVTIGMTSGASTPNRIVGEVIERLAELRGVEVPALKPLVEVD